MPGLADTTVRLLGQEPLAGRLPTAEQLRIAEILDKAGFAYLEVSGGGCFESAVRRGVESPWERIRALKSRVETPLGLALRGRFLVGSRPVDDDFIRRFIASAAASGIDVFRLHDPLNDVSNLREAAEAVARAGGEFEAGLVYSPGRTGETDPLMEQARELPNLGAARILLHDPTGSLQPHRARELVTGLRETTKLPIGIYCQGSAGNALAAALEAARAGAELIACAVYPIALTLHRVSGEAIAEALIGLGLECDVDVPALWAASDVVDDVRVLVEGRLGTPPAPIDKTVRRAVALTADPESAENAAPRGLQEVRAQAEGLASSEEELLLLGLFGDDAEPLLHTIRGRSSGSEALVTGAVDQARAERIRELVRIVQETGIGEVTIEESGMRVSVRRTEDREPGVAPSQAVPLGGDDDEPAPPMAPPSNGLIRVEAPMVGPFH